MSLTSTYWKIFLIVFIYDITLILIPFKRATAIFYTCMIPHNLKRTSNAEPHLILNQLSNLQLVFGNGLTQLARHICRCFTFLSLGDVCLLVVIFVFVKFWTTNKWNKERNVYIFSILYGFYYALTSNFSLTRFSRNEIIPGTSKP